MHSAMPVSTARTSPAPAGSSTATMAELLQVCGAPATLHGAATAVPLSLRWLRAGSALVHEGAPADSLFFVRSGTFKVSRTDEDGYEQVLAFAIRGEVLGFDALCMEFHPAAVLALEDSTVFMIPRRQIETYSEAVPSFAGALQQAGSLTLIRSREMVDILAAVASEVRLARFLILLSRRMAGCGLSPKRFYLRMGRRDIASLLGVAQETISRSFGALSAMGLLHVDDRNVEILNMTELKAFSRSTRRAMDEQALMRRRSLVTARRSGSLRPLPA